MKILRYIFATTVTVIAGLLMIGLLGLLLRIAFEAFLFGWALL